MKGHSDELLMLLIGLLIVVLIVFKLKSWMFNTQSRLPKSVPLNDWIPEHPALDLLEKVGYEVMGGRIKIPLYFEVNQQQEYHSRLFIDYVVKDRKDIYYLVKISRKRLPMDWTGSGIRDQLLPYFLLYPECGGLIYIDMELGKNGIRRIHFDWDEEEWIGYDD
ncbi:hypothetical protein [Paenibacillus pini]|uniref:Uncharacterized protein n=1 Tax=Paenibacillus pini JCM 16418 TaxID=1236976 RepID=W7YMU8_9BACL|nr:hypothetical protein [Paenibacillus pini]GAF08948.1 hypothetical protein JCM16418_3059 [Paenibacillus pini JCM 16418]